MGLAALWHVGSSWTRDCTVSPALAGRFFTTEPPGKTPHCSFDLCLMISNVEHLFTYLSVICMSSCGEMSI